MFHAVDFINCRVNAVFSHKDANGNINREFHHKGSSRVSSVELISSRTKKKYINQLNYENAIIKTTSNTIIKTTTKSSFS